VVSDKMEKTIVVKVERLVQHPLYKKTIRRSKKYKAHDETNACREGDRVLLTACRPLAKDKHWRVSQVLKRAAEA